MKNCLTKIMIFSEVSGCLVEKPVCSYSRTFGFSYVCCHPDHSKFHAHVVGALTKKDAIQLYDTLRQKRRDEFIASLDENSRKYFCQQTDFFGQPQANMDLFTEARLIREQARK